MRRLEITRAAALARGGADRQQSQQATPQAARRVGHQLLYLAHAARANTRGHCARRFALGVLRAALANARGSLGRQRADHSPAPGGWEGGKHCGHVGGRE